MASTVASTFHTTPLAKASVRPASRGRASVVVRAQQQHGEGLSRREAGLAALAAIAAFGAASPAHALFGIGEEKAASRYADATAKVIADVANAASLPRDAPNREETMKAVRKEMNDWVATYRRDGNFSGRPSFSNTYSAVNTLAGHLNSFGLTTPVPKKRLERMLKELEDAQRLLSRGR